MATEAKPCLSGCFPYGIPRASEPLAARSHDGARATREAAERVVSRGRRPTLTSDVLRGRPPRQRRPDGLHHGMERLGLREAADEAAYRRALTTREKAHGLRHPAVGDSLNSLALFLQERGRHAEAEALLLRAVAVFEERGGGAEMESPLHARLLLNLARTYGVQGKEPQAAEAEARAALIWTMR
jgi:tetratricopeptide (TPR) repeat protein